jgi:hypothetical protein
VFWGEAVDGEIVYSRGQLSAEQIEQEIGRFWAELDESSELQAELEAKGFESAALREIDPTRAIHVLEGSSGVDPLSVSIIIVFAPPASNTLRDVWSAVILPRIRRRWGADAVGFRGLGGDQSGD